uniref:jhy protein homolog isoform X2 n=1 Tax=Scatophagus argus TaxID=75038 RepID=UPI001ED7CDD8|nr:jhy protein homolog isoform X2 [Scatophagus argus]
MDKELKHEKICQVLKTEQEKHSSSLRQAVLVNQWDSVGSDTESLAQERTYLPQLQMLQHGDREDEDVQVIYDSLEVEGHSHAKRNPTLLQTEYVDTQLDEREGISQLRSDDAYSDLRYDPNWRTNLKGAGRFSESPRISVEQYQVPLKKSSQACGYKQGVEMKGDYRYIVDTSPAVVITPHMASNQSDQPYRLHPQDGQNTSIAFPHCYSCSLQLRSPEADLSRPSSILTKNESDNASQREIRKKCENGCDDVSRSHEPTEDVHTMYIPECKTFYQQEQRCTQGGSTQTQHLNMSVWSRKILSNKKLEGLKKDIVERNKLTLGRNTSKSGSYVSVHSLKHDKPHNVNKVQITKETASTESQEDSSDPKLRWLQNTQQLRVTQISKGKKAQRKEYLSPPQKERNPSPGVRDELGDCLSFPLARPGPLTQPKPQKTTSSQPLSPTFHLNINLKTSSHLPPLLEPRGQEAIIHMASLHDCPHGSFASQTELAQLSGYLQTNPRKYSQISWKGVNTQLHHQNLESIPEQWQRITAIKWPLSCDGDEQTWSPNELPCKQFPQNLPGTPTSTLSLGSGSDTVLPPIGKPAAGKQLSPSPNVNPAYAIHRSSSDGYLVQMEKQMQLKTRVAYKAYSLKDYKQLKSDVVLQGLGPDYRALEKTKMKRQRLYSNVIHEQNKKISRIPFLLAKDLEGNDKKVPRMKALEYAKTIAKPPVQPQPKQRRKHQSEGFTKHCPYLEALDMSPPATLEVLRKRHEEEKKAVALFRKEHVV